MSSAPEPRDQQYLSLILQKREVSKVYKPRFGQAREISLDEFRMLYGNHAFYSWFGLNNPLVYAAHNAAGGMTSLYRQIGTGCEHLFRRLIRDQFKLTAAQVAWSFTITVPGRKDRKLCLDHRALASFEEELDMRSGITGRRAPHEWPAWWLRATFPVVLGLGGLAGCALLTEVATPALGQSLDGVRQEVAQLRAETAQLGASFRVVEDGVWARDAVLVQLDAALAQLGKRLQVLEKNVPLLKRPSGPQGPLPAGDVPSALNRLAERLSAVEHRLGTLEGAPPELSRPPAPVGSGRGRPSGHWLQVGMSPDAVRARLGAPVSVEETPDFVFWHYGPERSVVFRRDTERVQGWLGFTAAHLENTLR